MTLILLFSFDILAPQDNLGASRRAECVHRTDLTEDEFTPELAGIVPADGTGATK
jgi:hypothetical protein